MVGFEAHVMGCRAHGGSVPPAAPRHAGTPISEKQRQRQCSALLSPRAKVRPLDAAVFGVVDVEISVVATAWWAGRCNHKGEAAGTLRDLALVSLRLACRCKLHSMSNVLPLCLRVFSVPCAVAVAMRTALEASCCSLRLVGSLLGGTEGQRSGRAESGEEEGGAARPTLKATTLIQRTHADPRRALGCCLLPVRPRLPAFPILCRRRRRPCGNIRCHPMHQPPSPLCAAGSGAQQRQDRQGGLHSTWLQAERRAGRGGWRRGGRCTGAPCAAGKVALWPARLHSALLTLVPTES